MKAFLALLLALALGGCMTPRSRVQAGLERAGLKPRLASCMAGRMVDRLSYGQLRELGRLPGAAHAHSVDRFLDRLGALGDPEIVSVTSKAALKCELDHPLD